MIIKIRKNEDQQEPWIYINVETLEDLKDIILRDEYKVSLDYKDYINLTMIAEIG